MRARVAGIASRVLHAWRCGGLVVLVLSACVSHDDLSRLSVGFDVTPDHLDFADMYVGLSRTKSVVLHNTGERELELELFSAGESFRVQRAVQVEAHNTKRIDVVFAPQVTGSFFSVLLVRGEGADPREVALTGRGVDAPACPAASACATFKLVESGDCVLEPRADGTGCDDASSCTEHDACVGGNCVGAPIACGASDACTIRSCDPASGCVKQPVVCAEDGNACTQSLCLSDRGCVHMAVTDSTPCDDNSLCTAASSCQAAVCRGEEIACSDSDSCTVDYCVDSVGCVFVPMTCSCEEGQPCSDGNACTTFDTCTDGECIGLPRQCPGTNACGESYCDPALGCLVAEASVDLSQPFSHEYANTYGGAFEFLTLSRIVVGGSSSRVSIADIVGDELVRRATLPTGSQVFGWTVPIRISDSVFAVSVYLGSSSALRIFDVAADGTISFREDVGDSAALGWPWAEADGYLYVGAQNPNRLVIIDAHDPAIPASVHVGAPLLDYAHYIVVAPDEHSIVVGTGASLQRFDISSPLIPIETAATTWAANTSVRGIAITSSAIAVLHSKIGYSQTLELFDFSLISLHAESVGNVLSISVVDDYLVLARNSSDGYDASTLEFRDIQLPTAPTVVGFSPVLPLHSGWQPVKSAGTSLGVSPAFTQCTSSFFRLHVGDGDLLQPLSGVGLGIVRGIALGDDGTLFTASPQALHKFDISSTTGPVLIDSVQSADANYFVDIALAGGHRAFQFFEVSLNSRFATTVSPSLESLASLPLGPGRPEPGVGFVGGEFLYLVTRSGLLVYQLADIADGGAPMPIDSLVMPVGADWSFGIGKEFFDPALLDATAGRLVLPYRLWGTNDWQLFVVDLADPTNPALLAQNILPSGKLVSAVGVHGDIVVVAAIEYPGWNHVLLRFAVTADGGLALQNRTVVDHSFGSILQFDGSEMWAGTAYLSGPGYRYQHVLSQWRWSENNGWSLVGKINTEGFPFYFDQRCGTVVYANHEAVGVIRTATNSP